MDRPTLAEEQAAIAAASLHQLTHACPGCGYLRGGEPRGAAAHGPIAMPRADDSAERSRRAAQQARQRRGEAELAAAALAERRVAAAAALELQLARLLMVVGSTRGVRGARPNLHLEARLHAASKLADQCLALQAGLRRP